ncbi:acyltransferase family protein [Vibrio splendidus]|uniref:acyltransferase family protein n=1 Tax=Vibrio splendidus TaxID=29497 RepID=UPI000D378214|nr:acyltransferase [Vibrio splendidus]PTO65247.1 hypothetical protein CWN99_08990 [Vibrio splendidus]
MVYLSEYLDERNNNFNLIRMLAAIAVIFSHSFILAYGPLNGTDPLVQYLGFPVSGLAVDIFFITSGLLVTKSLVERGSVRFFITARFLRIFPGLIVALVFSMSIIGSIATQLDFSDYISHPDTMGYIARNIWLFDNKIQFSLPGVFANLPYKHAVNGSLWTLPWEVYSYMSLLFLYLLFGKDYRVILLMMGWGMVALYTNTIYKVVDFDFLNPIYIKLLVMFYIGALFYLYKEKIKVNWLYTVLVVIGFYFIKEPKLSKVLLPFVISYLTISFAYLVKGFVLSYNKLGDFSYGTYIYAFPVQQLVVMYFSPGGWGLFFISTALTVLLAIFSWYCVESPSMSLRSRFFNWKKT